MNRLIAAAIVLVSIAAAQSPSFEVASVRQNRSPDLSGAAIRFLPGGGLSLVNIPLYRIIAIAYRLPSVPQNDRLSGGPAWARIERFDIQAKGSGGTPDVVRARLRSLLAERFRLLVRKESREQPVFALSIAKSGLKVRPSTLTASECLADENCHKLTGGQGDGLHGKAVELSDIALYLEAWSERPILDRTGRQGLFEIDTEGWASLFPPGVPPGPPLPPPGTAPDNTPARPTLFTILGKVGLKLEPAKGIADSYVIERVERPTSN